MRPRLPGGGRDAGPGFGGSPPPGGDRGIAEPNLASLTSAEAYSEILICGYSLAARLALARACQTPRRRSLNRESRYPRSSARGGRRSCSLHALHPIMRPPDNWMGRGREGSWLGYGVGNGSTHERDWAGNEELAIADARIGMAAGSDHDPDESLLASLSAHAVNQRRFRSATRIDAIRAL